VANRAQDTNEFQGKPVFKGGENSIAVYAINQSNGAPTPIQHIETQKIHPRTFHIDPSGRMLVAPAQSAGECAGRRCDKDSTGWAVDLPRRR
jgi:6-phosphogluconolactonase (cycloisomerase 2 family)